MNVTDTTEKQGQAEQPEAIAPSKSPSRKSVLALAVFALGINTSAAIYTLTPADFTLPDVSRLAELIPQLPQPKPYDPAPDPSVAALKDIQSAQQQHFAALRENSFLLQQSVALHQQDSITLASLRQSVADERVDVKKISTQITDEHEDVKKVSAKISTLIAKVDALQNSIGPEVTSSIPRRHARNRVFRASKNMMARQPKLVGPVSVGGAPLSFPATTPSPQG